MSSRDYIFSEAVKSGLYRVDEDGTIWTRQRKGVVLKEWIPAAVTRTNGRRSIRLLGVLVYTNRFIWYWFHGEIPVGREIDHIDENYDNEHILNLQPLTPTENRQKSNELQSSKYVNSSAKISALWKTEEFREKIRQSSKSSSLRDYWYEVKSLTFSKGPKPDGML